MLVSIRVEDEEAIAKLKYKKEADNERTNERTNRQHTKRKCVSTCVYFMLIKFRFMVEFNRYLSPKIHNNRTQTMESCDW